MKMKNISSFVASTAVKLDIGPGIGDITSDLNRLLKAANIEDGSLFATIVGSTGSITTIEFEPGVVEDLKRAINSLAPSDREYEHEKAWHDGNGHSHVQAALLGPSIVLPVRKGSLRLGTWQQVVAINHDNRPRTRTIEVTVMGTTR
jgi:secondary thiamine-phosphate synthase enzyme